MPRAHSRKSKVLFGYAVAITTALIVVVIMGGVYYYRSLDVLETALKVGITRQLFKFNCLFPFSEKAYATLSRKSLFTLSAAYDE